MDERAMILAAATTHWLDAPLTSPYRWTMLGAIVLSAWYWLAKSRRDPTLLIIYIGALGGAFLGAKLAYVFSEGWRDWSMQERWLRLAAGKSVVGGLLGGYAGVEFMKWLMGYRKSTGDLFALIVPLGIALGRVGCWLQGCCLGKPTSLKFLAICDRQGVARWPASQMELLFQMVMFAVLLILKRRGGWEGRLFFLYLFYYGIFRFFHEFLRDTPTMFAGLSGYQWLSVAMAAVGAVMLRRRALAAEKVAVAA
jgi:phosphatidylglycerol:prolipoprotein diacylglycerol transferase